jgi:hypothetical protein
MDRKSIIILLVSAALLALWYPITNKIFPPKPAPPPRTNTVSSVTNPAANRDARITNPGTTALPAAVTNLPPREERTLALESVDARYVFTSIGGGFKQIELKRFAGRSRLFREEVADQPDRHAQYQSACACVFDYAKWRHEHARRVHAYSHGRCRSS